MAKTVRRYSSDNDDFVRPTKSDRKNVKRSDNNKLRKEFRALSSR